MHLKVQEKSSHLLSTDNGGRNNNGDNDYIKYNKYINQFHKRIN